MKRAGALCQLYGVKHGYMPGLKTTDVWEEQGSPAIPDSGGTLWIQANRHLEAGHRIERWYPELAFKTPVPKLNTVLYKQEAGTPQYVVAFMAGAHYMEGNLLPGMWARIFQWIERNVAPVLIVGADRDVEFANRVCEIFDPTLAPVYNAALDQVLAAIKGARAMVGVASGLTILSTFMGTPTLSAYPRWLRSMPGAWEQGGAVTDWCFVDEMEHSMGKLEQLLSAGVLRENDGDNAGDGNESISGTGGRILPAMFDETNGVAASEGMRA